MTFQNSPKIDDFRNSAKIDDFQKLMIFFQISVKIDYSFIILAKIKIFQNYTNINEYSKFGKNYDFSNFGQKFSK